MSSLKESFEKYMKKSDVFKDFSQISGKTCLENKKIRKNISSTNNLNTRDLTVSQNDEEIICDYNSCQNCLIYKNEIVKARKIKMNSNLRIKKIEKQNEQLLKENLELKSKVDKFEKKEKSDQELFFKMEKEIERLQILLEKVLKNKFSKKEDQEQEEQENDNNIDIKGEEHEEYEEDEEDVDNISNEDSIISNGSEKIKRIKTN